MIKGNCKLTLSSWALKAVGVLMHFQYRCGRTLYFIQFSLPIWPYQSGLITVLQCRMNGLVPWHQHDNVSEIQEQKQVGR